MDNLDWPEARWLVSNRWVRIWYDISEWGIGGYIFGGSQGIGIHLDIGPFDITISKEYYGYHITR